MWRGDVCTRAPYVHAAVVSLAPKFEFGVKCLVKCSVKCCVTFVHIYPHGKKAQHHFVEKPNLGFSTK